MNLLIYTVTLKWYEDDMTLFMYGFFVSDVTVFVLNTMKLMMNPEQIKIDTTIKKTTMTPPRTVLKSPPVMNVLSISRNTKSAFSLQAERIIAMKINKSKVNTTTRKITTVAV